MNSSVLPVVIGMIVGVLLIGVMITVGDSLDRYGRPPYSTTNFQIITEPEAFRDDEYGEHGLGDVATLRFSGSSSDLVLSDPVVVYRYLFSPDAFVPMVETEDVDSGHDQVPTMTFDHELKLTIRDDID
jgi:hypothetical protein